MKNLLIVALAVVVGYLAVQWYQERKRLRMALEALGNQVRGSERNILAAIPRTGTA